MNRRHGWRGVSASSQVALDTCRVTDDLELPRGRMRCDGLEPDLD